REDQERADHPEQQTITSCEAAYTQLDPDKPSHRPILEILPLQVDATLLRRCGGDVAKCLKPAPSARRSKNRVNERSTGLLVGERCGKAKRLARKFATRGLLVCGT